MPAAVGEAFGEHCDNFTMLLQQFTQRLTELQLTLSITHLLNVTTNVQYQTHRVKQRVLPEPHGPLRQH